MSDRYRPPTGPKNGSRNYEDRKSSSKPSYKSYSQRDSWSRDKRPPTGPQRYNDRGEFRSSQTHNDASSGAQKFRPSGPSGYRKMNNDGRNFPSSGSRDYNNKGPNQGGIKRPFPLDPQGSFKGEKKRNVAGPSSRAPSGPSAYAERDADTRGSKFGGKSYKSGFSKFPKGPKSSYERNWKGPINKNPSATKKSGPPSVQKLSRSQIYSIKVSRPSEVYQRVQQVGEGTYGKVYKAKNTKTDEFVALKKLRLESEREGFPITALREIKLLQSFDHENVVGLLEMMIEHNQIYMVLDYMDHDLTGLLTHPDLKLEECHKKFIFQQLMQGLDYLHKRRVIHRDIKGSNILLDNIGRVKITDFGLARTMKIVNDGTSPDYTNRVITIWYRPPELLLGSTDYGREVDIWGVGCLLIELYSKIAAFQGFEEIGQLYKIFSLMGTPTVESWPGVEGLPWFEMLKPKMNKASRFKEQYSSIMSKDSFDLAENLLKLNPSQRPTAEEALKFPYFTQEPLPQPLDFLKDVKGEWHEFETKKRRRKERKRLQEEKSLQQQQNEENLQSQPESQQSIAPASHSTIPETAAFPLPPSPTGSSISHDTQS